ncbi:unnamed protein product [Blepharisma stoltei]|uniref:Uncharacterized protein n=1 Tax=Blepharisma stoltei TaxID=1481888 RepID=A0AAU9I4P6_9CILI|nr:unnamed protein product [Blepharisma stoltei]
MQKQTARLLYITLGFLVCKELFNYKLHVIPQPLVPLSNKSSRKPISVKRKLTPPNLSLKTKKKIAKKTQNENTITEKNTNEEPRKNEEIQKEKPLKSELKENNSKIARGALNVNSSANKNKKRIFDSSEEKEDEEEEEDVEIDSSIYRLIDYQDIEEDREFLKEYAKIYKQRIQTVPKKRKPETTYQKSAPRKIGKEREIFKALGKEINLYKQTQFLEEYDTSKIILEEYDFDATADGMKNKKMVRFAIDEPKTDYMAIPIWRFTVRAEPDSYEKVLQDLSQRNIKGVEIISDNPSDNSLV